MTPLQQVIAITTIGSVLSALPAKTAAVTMAPVVYRIPEHIRQLIKASKVIDIPHSLRTRNWTVQEGSCAHASLCTLLKWQGQHKIAGWWQRNNGNGSTAPDLGRRMDAAKLDYALGTDGDVSFLEWACSTRRGACVPVQNGAHMVNLVGLDHEYAYLLDNNQPEVISKKPRNEFLTDWRASGGNAITPMYMPAPPKPWEIRGESQ